MRGLLEAALVLAPALALAYVVPDLALDTAWEREEPLADPSIALIDVEIRSDPASRDGTLIQTLPFRLEVLPSEEPCSHGNITLDGEVLPQRLEGDISTGQGPISTDGKSVVVASWSFRCIKVNNQPDSQLLKLAVNLIDGKSVENTGFSVLFRQVGPVEIISITTDFSVPDSVVANPDAAALLLAGEDAESHHYNVEDEMAELDWMYAQLHELKLMIAEKHEAIAAHAWEHSDDYDENIKDCDSLKCVLAAVYRKAKFTASEVYGHLTGEEGGPDEEVESFPKPPFKKPHWPKIPKIPFHPGKGKHGNHTCGPPNHGKHNHTGNHTHPPPHHRRPHHFLPICRLPPHHTPHHPPPGHGPPSHEPPHHSPPSEGHPQSPPLHHQESLHHPDFLPPPPSFPHPMNGEDNPPPPPPPAPPANHFGPSHGPPRHHSGLHKTLQTIQYAVIGFLVAFLLIALHRRTCSSSKRADRKASREERRRRRAFRHAAQKQAISRLLSRISGDQSSDESFEDYDEKRAALLSDSEDGMSTTMTDEITEFRNAASIVDDMVSAEEGRARTVAYAHGLLPAPVLIPSHDRDELMREYDFEDLPAYEVSDGSEMSSMVADGFRYTPGSSDYSPQNSASGSVDDVLGPDTKI